VVHFTESISGRTIPDEVRDSKFNSQTYLYLIVGVIFVFGVGCANRTAENVAYKEGVKHALEQAELTDVSVAEDRDKNTIFLGGAVHSDDAKAKAAEVAKGAAGDRIIVNEVRVRPAGAVSSQ